MEYNRKEYVWYRNKEWYPIKVEEIIKDIDINNFNTVIPILKKLDYPAIKHEWEHTVKYGSTHDQGPEVIFKKYISKMWLKAYKPCTFKDSKLFNQP